MRGNVRLNEDGASFWIDATRDKQSCDVERSLAQHGGILRNRQSVLVDDAKVALRLVLELDKVANRSQIVADSQSPTRLDARKYGFEFHFG